MAAQPIEYVVFVAVPLVVGRPELSGLDGPTIIRCTGATLHELPEDIEWTRGEGGQPTPVITRMQVLVEATRIDGEPVYLAAINNGFLLNDERPWAAFLLSEARRVDHAYIEEERRTINWALNNPPTDPGPPVVVMHEWVDWDEDDDEEESSG